MRVVAVDWSGRIAGAKEHLWLAEARDDELVRLEGGRSREELIDHLVTLADAGPLVVGFDFSFALPAWFLTERGYDDGPGLWRAATTHGEDWLRDCPAPFWGRPGKQKPIGGDPFRVTERALSVGGISPKSTFQIGGAGAVGTGSVRGWPHLVRLRAAGFAIWPFDEAAGRLLAVEVWPRLCTGPVAKSNPLARVDYLERHLPHLTGKPRDLMCASEDAFDAACTALAMAREADTFASLPSPADAIASQEGWVWSPSVTR
jgi:hypothetical protein